MIISKRSSTLLTGSVAGLIGGFVELGWVTLYGDITDADPHQLAPGIVSAAGVRALLPVVPPRCYLSSWTFRSPSYWALF